MASSTIPAFKAALLARLTVDVALGAASPPVQVSWGHPYPKQPERDLVIIGRAESAADEGADFPGGQRSGALGRFSREERYVVTVAVSVLRQNRDAPYSDIETRAYQIASAVEVSLRTWAAQTIPYDGIVRWAFVTSCGDDVEAINTEEREARVLMRLSCSQRLT